MQNLSMHSFSTGQQITKFHIPGNGVIINGLPKFEKEPILSEVKILKSKIELLESEIQKTREESYEEGFNACKRSLEEQNLNELKIEKELIFQLKTNLENEIKDTVSNIYHPILEISKNIAFKIIEEELDSSEKWINTIQSKIEKFCKELSEQTNMTIKVHSDSVQYFQNSEFEIEKIDSKLLSFIGDDSLEHGECIIESDNHIIDATFQTQITHIINNIS